MILNIVVGVVVRAVLDVVCGPQEAQHGLVWAAGERNLIFYADDGRIAGQDHVWVQDALPVTVEMFCRMGLGKLLKGPRLWSALKGSSGGSGGNQ